MVVPSSFKIYIFAICLWQKYKEKCKRTDDRTIRKLRKAGSMKKKKMGEYARFLVYQVKKAYQSFGVNIDISKMHLVPALQRFIFLVDILPGTRLQGVFTHAKDVQSILRFFLFYPFRKGTYVLLAVSEVDIKENSLIKILQTFKFLDCDMQIPLALGYDILGSAYIVDLARLFHLLVVGPSGTGKSMALQCMIMSIVVKCPVKHVRLILFDIGANSLQLFEDLRHLYHPLVKDIETGIIVLEALVAEMDKRIMLGEDEREKLPFIICIIDEYDDTIASIDGKEKCQKFIAALNSIIRRGRKAKVVLILASHDPSLKNAKVNISGIVPRIAFKCANHYSSSTALGVTGAENLSGGGTMLFRSQDESTPKLLQGSFITETEIKNVLINRPDENTAVDMLDIKYTEPIESVRPDEITMEKSNRELAEILLWVLGQKKVSILQIQQKFHIGKRASEIVNILYNMGIITEKFSNQPRKVIPNSTDDLNREIICFLERFNYDLEEIEKVFDVRKQLSCNFGNTME